MEGETREQSGGADLSDSQMDALLGGESANRDIPMHGAPDSPAPAVAPSPAAAATTQAAPSQAPTDLAFDYNGKPVKVPFTDPRVAQWARQGYDYNQRMAEFGRKSAEIEARAKSAQALETKYKEIDDYARQNPAFLEHLTKTWESRNTLASPNDPLQSEVLNLRKELQDLQAFKKQLSEERTLQVQKQEDDHLSSEMETVSKAYPSIDFKSLDAEGKSLELRVLEHAAQTGIKSFRAAFRDYKHDDLIKLEAERAKETLAQDLQKKKSLGFIGSSQSPKKALTKADDIKNKSYDELYREGLAELGIAN